MSDDSLAFCPTMYNRVFTWVETRAKSELIVRLVPLNMLKLSSFSFHWRRTRRSSFPILNVLKPGLYMYTVLRCVCVVGGGLVVVVGQDVITIETSTMTPLSAAVSRVLLDGAVVTNAFHSHNACWYMHALNSNGNEHRR